jgi:excisionase family DNA binding protein
MGANDSDAVRAVVAAIRRLPTEAARAVAEELAAAVQSEWLLVEEAAAIARVSRNTVRWWTQTRRLRSSRAGRRVRIRRTDLSSFLENGSQP